MKLIVYTIVLIIIIYMTVKAFQLYKYNNTFNPILLREVIKGTKYGIEEKDVIVLKDKQIIEGYKLNDKIPLLNGGKKWSVNLWIKPENQTANFQADNQSQQQHLLEWGKSFYIYYEPLRNELVIGVNVIVVKGSQEFQEFRIPNIIKIQKWNMVTVSFDNRLLDVFIDGKLKKSIVLYNVPTFDEGKWLCCKTKTFIGKITAVQFFLDTLNDDDVMSIYNKYNIEKPHIPFFWWLWKKDYIIF